LKKNEKTAVDKVDCHQPRIMAEHRILVGINEVTKHLEQMIQSHHNEIKVPENMLSNKILTPAIFICRRDIKPIHLCLHLLTLAALANVKLIPLPADSEAAIAQALNLKRVSALFLEVFQKL
jgi:ribosomal protein L7Ae-like RNA K-turn-binding protein